MEKKRLITRSDFDGLVCAMLLKELDMIDEIKFVHPKDVQDGKVDITENDITTNLPFDICLREKSAARVVYNYYGGADKFKTVNEEIMSAVDKGDSADFTIDEILNPKGWVLMNFIMDARTGLGRFHDFRISNYQLMMELIDYCAHHTIDEVLEHPDVKERTEMYFEQQELFKKQLSEIVKIEGKVAVIDLRPLETIYTGNRFMVYAMYPEAEVSVHVAWGFQKQNTAVMIGKSIINKAGKTDIGQLCLSYGGGGHTNAGTCQLDNDIVDKELPNIIAVLNGEK